MLNHSAYAQASIDSEHDETAKIRLSVDDWAIVWLNDERVATIMHEKRFETVVVPVQLRKGSNKILIKTNNTDSPPNKRHWAFHFAIEE